MNTQDAIISRRSKRKFIDKPVEHEQLIRLTGLARMAPSGANLQPIKYMIIDDTDMVKKVFTYTKWSGYAPDQAPKESEQPTAYIALLGDKSIKPNGAFETDAGACGTIITLAATDMGLDTCWLGAIDRKALVKLLNIKEPYDLLYLIAVGYSVQECRSMEANDDIKYFTDEHGILNVPKRQINELLINI